MSRRISRAACHVNRRTVDDAVRRPIGPGWKAETESLDQISPYLAEHIKRFGE